jgi:Ser-tRNA(Ala) deacylase AlaX
MTEKLYWSDAYIREFDAHVIVVDGNKVELDRTAFNPRGGGLESDTGTLAGLRVSEVTKEGEGVVLHSIAEPVEFKVGDSVHGVLDWEKRHRIMRMHTAAHILSSVVNRETGALITGNQIRADESRVDFNLDSFDRDKLSYYIDQVNAVVERGVEVTSFFMKKEEAMGVPGLVKLANAAPPAVDVLRIVKIGDVDMQADGGVHVKNTREIEKVIALRADNKGKSNRRLYFTIQ